LDVSEAIALSAVICEIYDASIDPSKWTTALAAACNFVGGFQALMFWQDAATGNVATLHTYNDDPHYTRLYMEVYAPLNPVFPAAIFNDVGAVLAASDMVPPSEMQRTRFFKEWIAPQGMGESFGIVLEREATRAAFLTVQMRESTVEEESRRRMTLLVPHFQRAVAIGSLFSREKETSAALTETVNRFDAGVFLISRNGQIVFANSLGREMIEDGSLLRASSDALRAANPEADKALRESFRAIEDEDPAIGAQGITIPLSDASERRWIVNVLPLVDGARRETGAAYHAVAAVFVRSSSSPNPTQIETLAKRYKLTASEIRVAEAVLRVSGNDAIATALGLSRATVKTHLNRIFRKTAARNQSELIKLIAGL
jgi:DNA-binding CsgD family transcriptional regulator